jgi:hypothetical protein
MQSLAQFVLQQPKLMGNSRLRDMQLLCCLSQVQVVGDDNEHAKLAKSHRSTGALGVISNFLRGLFITLPGEKATTQKKYDPHNKNSIGQAKRIGIGQ